MMSKAGMSVIIEYIQDAEAARAAGNIAFLFKQAKWKILAYNPTLEPIFDGVFVESYFPSLDDLSASKVEAWQRSSDICALVVRDLLENNWKASPKPGLPGKLTPELIRVQVGLKPFPYFQNEATKQDQVSLEKFVGVNRHRNDGKEIESSIVPGPGPNLVDSFTIRQSPPPKQDHN
jgi:hypothetical protein